MKRFLSKSPGETFELGKSFAGQLKPGDVVGLSGELGTGKTQFIRGVCAGLGAGGHVASPTFTFINEYPVPWGTVAHIDMFRIDSPAEIAEIGVSEYFNERCICLIEWSERIMDLLPTPRLEVRIAYGDGAFDREITISEIQRVAA